jgi:hypothetical protein
VLRTSYDVERRMVFAAVLIETGTRDNLTTHDDIRLIRYQLDDEAPGTPLIDPPMLSRFEALYR